MKKSLLPLCALLLSCPLLVRPACAVGAEVAAEPSLRLEAFEPFAPGADRTTVHLSGAEGPATAVVEDGALVLRDHQPPAQGAPGSLLILQDPDTGLYGYADASGAVVIPCVYDGYMDYEFRCDEPVQPVRRDGGWGLVRRDGSLVVPCVYGTLNLDADNPDYVRFTTREDPTKWGLMDATGKVLLEPSSDSLDGMVYAGGQWYVRVYQGDWPNARAGLLDLEGNVFVPSSYMALLDCREGMIPMAQGEKWGFLNDQGEVAVPCRYDRVEHFQAGRAAVAVLDGEQWRWGFIDKSGREVVPLAYDYVEGFNAAGLAVAASGNGQVLLDRSGDVVALCPYTGVSAQLSGGLMVFWQASEEGYRYGYLDQYGREAIPARFEYALPFQNGLAVAVQDGKYGLIDWSGAFVLPPEYNDVALYAPSDYVWIVKEDLYGVARLDDSVTGTPDTLALTLDGNAAALPAYTIQNGAGGVTCVKLRDAALLSGTRARFNVTWDGVAQTIVLTPGAPYQPVGGEGAALEPAPVQGRPNRTPVRLNRQTVALDAYTFLENNYVPLRELGRLLDFSVDWAGGHIVLDTSSPYWRD